MGCLLGTLIGVLPGIGPVATHRHAAAVTFHAQPHFRADHACRIYYGASTAARPLRSWSTFPVNRPRCDLSGRLPDGPTGQGGAALGIAAIGSFFAGASPR